MSINSELKVRMLKKLFICFYFLQNIIIHIQTLNNIPNSIVEIDEVLDLSLF